MTLSFNNCCEIKRIAAIAILVKIAIASITNCAQSQTVPDNTLGNERSIIRQKNIKGIENDNE